MATSATCLQAFRLRRQPAWGLQFHPEATYDDLVTWLERWHTDPRAVATGLDPEAIRRETAARIDDSNLLGTAIIERFLVHAKAVRPGAGHHRATTAGADPTVYTGARRAQFAAGVSPRRPRPPLRTSSVVPRAPSLSSRSDP